MVDIKERIIRRISQRTGLKNPEEINAYAHFCLHSDLEEGVVMYGDVAHEFYEELLSNCSLPMKVLEHIYHEAVGNNIHEDLQGNRAKVVLEEDSRKLKSPLSKQAQKEFDKFYWKFVLADLIEIPEKFGKGFTKEFYPRLKSYNYFNDPEFYRKTSDGNGRELII